MGSTSNPFTSLQIETKRLSHSIVQISYVEQQFPSDIIPGVKPVAALSIEIETLPVICRLQVQLYRPRKQGAPGSPVRLNK